MSRPSGQALRWARRLAGGLIALVLVLAVGLGALAWRLAEQPLVLPPLARQIERAVNAALDGPRIEIVRAAIAWEGWRDGVAAPLDIRLSGVRLLDSAGEVQAELPDASATLSFRALLRGILAPATIILHWPSMAVVRAEDGSFGLALGPPADAPAQPAPEAAPGAGPVLLDLLTDLMQPASDRDSFAALRRIRIIGGEIRVVDRSLHRSWMLADPQIDIHRAAAGGLTAEGAAVIRSGGLIVPVRLSGAAAGAPMRLSLGMTLPALRPPQLAEIWPPLAPLAVLDAAVSLAATAELDAKGRPERLLVYLDAGAGALDLGQGQRLPFAEFDATLEGSGRALRLTGARLALPGPGAHPGPVIVAAGEATMREGRWQARLDFRADPLAAAALGRAWPAGLAPKARQAVLGALPAGVLRDARLRLFLTAPESLDRVELAEARLGMIVTEAVFAFGGSRIGVAAADLALSLTPDALRLERLVAHLASAGGPGLAGPAVTATAEAARRDGLWRGSLTLGVDVVRFAELPAYWPEELAQGAREWVTGNVTAGEVRGGQWRFEAEVPETLDAFRLTGLSGRAEASGATVHWMRPIPPLQGVAATAEFALNEINIRSHAGRQPPSDGRRGGMEIREAAARIFNLDVAPGNAEIAVHMAGPLADAWAVVRHPRLHLFDKRKVNIGVARGQVDTRVQIAFPLYADLPLEMLKLHATARISEARLTNAIQGQELDRANLELVVDTESLKLSGQGALLGSPVRLGVDMDFRPGPAAGLAERASLTGRIEARRLAALGLDAGWLMQGPVGIEARYERRRNGQGQVALKGDLRDARMGLEPIGWAKPPGTPATAEAVLRLQGDDLRSIEGIRLDAPGTALRGRAVVGPQSRVERFEIADGLLNGSRFAGEVRGPTTEGAPWLVALRGPLLDLRPILSAQGDARSAPPGADQAGPPLVLDLRFDRATMGEGRNLFGIQARIRTDARGMLREAQAGGRTAAQAAAPGMAQPGGFEFALTPRGRQRLLRLGAEDGGALLRALDLVQSIRGGRLTVTAAYDELRPGAPLSGTAELDQFVVRDAPGAAKLLQAMTLYGLVEAMQGGDGLVFNRLIAPFILTPEALALNDARAFSASLGITAKGRLWLQRGAAEIEGTIVPAYMLNTLLGNIPVLGRLFSPEAGGGVFAATFRVHGALSDPTVTVNPLAALTPGFLRGLFGILGQPGQGEAPQGGGAQ